MAVMGNPLYVCKRGISLSCFRGGWLQGDGCLMPACLSTAGSSAVLGWLALSGDASLAHLHQHLHDCSVFCFVVCVDPRRRLNDCVRVSQCFYTGEMV